MPTISAALKTRTDHESPDWIKISKRWLEAFLFPAESDTWLTILRIGLGFQVVFYAWSLRSDWNYLLGSGEIGLNGRALSEGLLSLESPFVPRLGWFISMLDRFGVPESTALSIAWWILLLSGCCLLLGFLSRPSAISTWFVHLSVVKSAGTAAYGVDNFTTIGLFYLMISPLPDRFTLDRNLLLRRVKDPQLLGFFRRVLQLHLCLIYFFGGLAKCLGSGWWNGSSLWRSLIRPPFNIISPEILVHWKYIFPITGIAIWLLEISYPFFIWNRRLHGIWLTSICTMHLAIGLGMGMYLFASIMIVLNIAAFGPGLANVASTQAASARQEAPS